MTSADLAAECRTYIPADWRAVPRAAGDAMAELADAYVSLRVLASEGRAYACWTAHGAIEGGNNCGCHRADVYTALAECRAWVEHIDGPWPWPEPTLTPITEEHAA